MSTQDRNEWTEEEIEWTEEEIAAFHQRMYECFAEMQDRESFDLPRWRYFQQERGPMYCWTTERDADGWFWSWVAYPVGPGARSGTAQTWERSPASMHKNRRRKDAKARALRQFEKWRTK